VIDKDYNRAIALFTEALAVDQRNTDARFFRAVSKLDSGNIPESIVELKEIIAGGSSHSPVCHILLSIAYKRTNDQLSAISILSACIQAFPTYPDAYMARGQAQLLTEKYD
jgi:lipopolysaccharide biosynthesis regulator YciM